MGLYGPCFFDQHSRACAGFFLARKMSIFAKKLKKNVEYPQLIDCLWGRVSF